MKRHYLTRYIFEPAAIQALKIRDTYGWHRVVYDQYDDIRTEPGNGSSGILWAVDKRRGNFQLTALSDRPPHRTIEAVTGASMSTAELSESFLDPYDYAFRTVVNPVRSVKRTGDGISRLARGVVVPVKGRDEIGKWFLRLAASHGFSIKQDSLEIGQIIVDGFAGKAGHRVTLQKARITGICHVEDRELFKKAVLGGIGRGKAFGCGLLQVVPIQAV